jgi:hypothetical protein
VAGVWEGGGEQGGERGGAELAAEGSAGHGLDDARFWGKGQRGLEAGGFGFPLQRGVEGV